MQCGSRNVTNKLQFLLTYSIPIEVCQSAGFVAFEIHLCTFISMGKGACSVSNWLINKK